MPHELCPRGNELFSKATQADDVFKANLLKFFAAAKKDDQEMKQIEVLGEQHREADEAFHRHKRFCAVCVELRVVSRYVAAD
ncbi:MAG TPA: hypothetical protein VH724_15060 [Candidatus Angelobacter sp.]|nr:hypothetical protein [Candidatus Angelobacter sp.]HEX4605318.1 hypothetical protein [Candidatus Angelobacter sp.]